MDDADISKKLPAARQVAERMLRTRFIARNKIETEYFEGVIQEQDEIIEKGADFTEQKAQIDMTVTLMEAQDDIYSRTNAIEGTPEEKKLYDRTPVNAGDQTLSTAERSIPGLENWYVNMFHHLNPDAVTATNRDALFNTFHQMLPPDKMREILAANPGKSAQEFMKAVINYTRDRALAL
jgi:hypothetical protein